eukprot:3044931-Amphidinium_carterae.1
MEEATWERTDPTAECFLCTRAPGPPWNLVYRRVTYDLETKEVIQDVLIAEITTKQRTGLLPNGHTEIRCQNRVVKYSTQCSQGKIQTKLSRVRAIIEGFPTQVAYVTIEAESRTLDAWRRIQVAIPGSQLGPLVFDRPLRMHAKTRLPRWRLPFSIARLQCKLSLRCPSKLMRVSGLRRSASGRRTLCSTSMNSVHHGTKQHFCAYKSCNMRIVCARCSSVGYLTYRISWFPGFCSDRAVARWNPTDTDRLYAQLHPCAAVAVEKVSCLRKAAKGLAK